MKIIADQNIPFAERCFSTIGSVQTLNARDITPETIKDADVLLVRSTKKVNESLLQGSNVKFIATATIGTEHIDTDYLHKNNIAFASAPGANANSVAEYVTAALLNIAQKYKVKLSESSIGIIGAGNIGSNLNKKFQALGMRTLLNDPPLQRKTNDPQYLPIEDLYNCDFITFHTPLTKEGPDKTYHLADKIFLSKLKKGTFIINTSRGSVINTKAIEEAIRKKTVKAAVLDVWESEPNIDTLLVKNAFLATPHIAGYSLDGKAAGTIMVYNALCKHLNMQPTISLKDILPAPSTPMILINQPVTNIKKTILQTIEQVYNINKDNNDLKLILNMEKADQPRYFSRLRKNYFHRREFHNTIVSLSTQNPELQNKLTALGFQVTINE